MAEGLSRTALLQQKYMEFFELPVEKNVILLESLLGKELSQSMQVLAKALEVLPEFEKYTVYVVCTPKTIEKSRDYFRWIDAPWLHPVLHATEEYNRILATAGVLISENPFPHHFIKREEQVYIRMWDSIPMEAAGRYSETDYAGVGNLQRNLWCADYLICPNEFTMHRLADDYMLSNLGRNKILYTGRLQNDILFDEAGRKELHRKFDTENKQILFYMPDMEGLKESSDKADVSEEQRQWEQKLWEAMCRLDAQLSDSQVLFVKVPYYLREEYAYASLAHIRFMPRSARDPQMLAMADVLITDGSELVFDFGATRRKIVLFSHDCSMGNVEKRYRLHEKFPFARADSVEELVKEINTGKGYDDTLFFEAYCRYNKKGMAEAVLRHAVLKEECPELVQGCFPDNGKKNVVIYPGPLFKNGITASILSLLEHLDRDSYNYTLFFRTELVRPMAETLKELPEGVSYYGYTYVEAAHGEEKEIFEGWQKEPDYPYETAEPVIYRRMERERQRLLSFLWIDTVIHYEGYGRDILTLFELMPCKKIVYVHNNMLLEVEKKGIRPEPLCRAYNTFDTVALVSEEQRPVAEKMVAMDGGDPEKSNIVLAKNVIPYERVVSRAKEALVLDEKTELNVSEEQLRQLLASSKKKFVTIGRFLPEKGHERMIRAFERVHEEYPDSCLIMLGGYGPLYEETVEQAGKSPAAEDIVIIKYLSNPYALLSACDYFVLSSYYEGLPVVLTEADIIGLPCVSTDIPGPRRMMGQYGGLLVEDSEQGVFEGMYKCMTGQAPGRFTINYLEYNKEAVRAFEAMLPER